MAAEQQAQGPASGRSRRAATLTPAALPGGEVMVYEFGARLDPACEAGVAGQIALARRLYNDLVAQIQQVVAEVRRFVLDRAGPEAAAVSAELDGLNAAFAEARRDGDEGRMRRVAEARRDAGRALAALLKPVRQAHRAEIQTRFLGRLGKNSACETYAIRSQAVEAGLGWGTANAVLDAALVAFRKTFAMGQAPRFAVESDRAADTLTLQFTTAGGVAAAALLAGGGGDLALLPPGEGAGRRRYGTFRFRLGAAKAGQYAVGTWQYHRPLPEGARVGMARLVRRRVGADFKYAIQLVTTLAAPVRDRMAGLGGRKPLVAVHFGWAADPTGRRIAGVAEGADPQAAWLLQLPTAIEAAFLQAAAVAGERDRRRDAVAPRLADIRLSAAGGAAAQAELAALRALPSRHVALRRLHGLCALLREDGMLPDWLEEWRREDRLLWQRAAHGGWHARNSRRNFYRHVAIDLGRRYDAIAIEPVRLQDAALEVNPRTGTRSEFGLRARAGRVVAALSELEAAIRWAAVKTSSALIEVACGSATECALCGDLLSPGNQDPQVMICSGCGAVLDRKRNAAALVWRQVAACRDDLLERCRVARVTAAAEQQQRKTVRLQRMAASRSAAKREESRPAKIDFAGE